MVVQSLWIGGSAAPADEACPVSLIRDAFCALDRRCQQVEQGWRCIVCRPSAACAHNGLRCRQDFRFNKKLFKRRVRCIGCCRGQHHFCVTGEIQRPGRWRVVGDTDTAQLHAVFGRHHHFHLDRNALVAAAKCGASSQKEGFIHVCRLQRGLLSDRPDMAAGTVAQIAKAAPRVTGRILAPARQRQSIPLAVAAA